MKKYKVEKEEYNKQEKAYKDGLKKYKELYAKWKEDIVAYDDYIQNKFEEFLKQEATKEFDENVEME